MSVGLSGDGGGNGGGIDDDGDERRGLHEDMSSRQVLRLGTRWLKGKGGWDTPIRVYYQLVSGPHGIEVRT